MSREHFFIKPRFQIRYLLKTLITVVVTVVILYVFLRNELAVSLRHIVGDAEIAQIIWVLSKTFFIIFLILVVAFGLHSFFTSHGLAGAVFSIERSIKNLSEGNLKTVVEVRKTDELREMVVQLQQMISKLRNAIYVDRQKAFEVKHLIKQLSETLDKEGSNYNARKLAIEADEKLSSITAYFKI